MAMASRRLGLESSNLLEPIENPWSFIIGYIQKNGYCYIISFMYDPRFGNVFFYPSKNLQLEIP